MENKNNENQILISQGAEAVIHKYSYIENIHI